MVEYDAGKWRCVAYTRANGFPVNLTNMPLATPTLTSPVINTSVSGSAFQDDDTFASAAPDKFASCP